MKKRIGFTLVLMASIAWAQQPAPASPGGDSSSKTSQSSDAPKVLEPDKPLYQQSEETPVDDSTQRQPTYNSGVIASGVDVGTPFKHPVLTPSFNFVQSLQSQESAIGNGMIWKGRQTVAGALSFQWDVGRTGSLLYNGTGYWNSYDSGSDNGGAQTVQQLTYSQKFQVARWLFSIADQASYSPQSIYGFGGLQGLYGSAGMGPIYGGSMLPPVGLPGTTPSQSIFTSHAPRVANATLGEVQYSLTPRDSVRFGGNYGIVRGIDNNLVDGNQYSATAGVDHRLDASNTLGVTYAYNVLDFPDGQENVRTNSLGLSWARRLTGRLNVQAYGGAQYVSYTQLGVGTDRLSWNASATLNYIRTRNSMNVWFYQGVTGGAGIFAGANSTSINGGYSHLFSPRVSVGVNGGYSRNESIQQSNQYTNSYYGGAQVSRRVGRDASLYFGYYLQRQTVSQSTVAPLAFYGTQHTFSIGINWSHPIRIAQ